ncbi:uncharacterized protein LOC119670353 isoform X2 [Teleopsis dalmanni]|uniref:uncharacterized protein LOC119670353 isoform X2 n=1 Tax=Teleopsis dalmanni TaxID=139649 RepID=UPI0018CD0E45|nr:uncharacterized protein LOC119670353 isoform X2 [Teleopsis dalmanni]
MDLGSGSANAAATAIVAHTSTNSNAVIGIEGLQAGRSLDRQHQHQQQQQHQNQNQQQHQIKHQHHQYHQLSLDDNDKSPLSNCSIVSSSNSTTSSEPHYSENVRRQLPTGLNLLPHQGSASSTKTCEVDVGDEERDTYSPISSSLSNTPSDAAAPTAGTSLSGICNGNGTTNVTVDNKIYDGSPLQPLTLKSKVSNGISSNALPAASKEEKQRQNEEIVIMETSSISSETGSWESVFPHNAVAAANISQLPPVTSSNICDADLRDCCTEFLYNERKEPTEETEQYAHVPRDESNLNNLKEPDIMPFLRERTYSAGATVTADTSSLFTGISASSLLRDFEKRENPLSTSGTSACFIDASSLRDEDEVLSFPSLDGHQSNDELDTQPFHQSKEKDVEIDVEGDSPTKKLETFHKAFAKCKVKSKELIDNPNNPVDVSNLSSGSNSSAESPLKPLSVASASPTNNLSDEEKLWKREHGIQKNQFSCELREKENGRSQQQQQSQQHCSAHEDATEASVSLAADVDSSDSSEIVKLRREQERKHGPYVFQHNMQHFSIHPLAVSPKFAPLSSAAANGTHPSVAHTAHSDLSYTTDYSSSSPAPSLVWSEHEQRPSTVGRHHNEDYDSHIQKPSILPDTPHNSIVHIDPGSSNTSSIHRDYTLSSSLSHQRDSGAYCSDATDSPIPMPRTPKRSKFDEANPIISGGVSIKDFTIKQCESPPIKRRTDTCPIVSGGFISLDFEATKPQDEEDEEVELRAKPKTRKPIPGIASWVVDMSDCRPERRRSTSSTSSIDALPVKFRERSDSNSSHKSGCGFYVSLDDMDKKPEDPNVSEAKAEMSKSYTAPKSTGFFVNLSSSECKAKDAPVEEVSDQNSGDKKNIFSMFIDIGEKKPVSNGNGKREPFSLAQRLSSSFTSNQRRIDEPLKSSASSTETLMSKSNNFKTVVENENGESKSLDYKCNIEPPITVAAIRRISQQQRAQSEAAKRHSWSNNQTKDGTTHDYKRSISLTANGDAKDSNSNGLMSIIDKIPLISKTSSLSVDSSLSPYDDYTGSKSGLSTSSNNSARNSMSGGEREEDAVNGGIATRIKKRRRDVQINETFDKSSLASITDGVLSKDLSPGSTTDTDDLTFQQDEELATREVGLQQVPPPQIPSNRSSAIIMETIIEAKETSSPKKSASSHTMESLHATIEKQKMLLETVNENAETEKSAFVKLSDMDKPVKFELQSPDTMSKSVGNHRQINRLFQNESKTRPHSWTMTRSTGNSFLNITNSVDNLRSLSRLFPNFSKEFSNSLPHDFALEQNDYIQTDISADSSLASSFSRSGMDESSISCRQPRRLGEDLLKMFLQEIATDMIVEVNGRRIKAHKCILRSRCQYFAAMLAGNSNQSVVSLQGYSYSAVHFALCHIYSGASHPPDGISLMELAALADLLGLEGLKEVTAHALKTNYCHNFHKPCSGCIDGILQVLPVALNHALDDLYRKCLRWTCRHYLKVWPTRQFAQLPPDILGRCRQQIVAYLTSESVLDTVLDCDNLVAQLSSYRWGGICENLVRDILEAAYAYIADHFASLIASDAFLSLGHDRSCHIPRLEDVLLRTASSLTPDQACRSYQRVTRLNTVLQAKVLQMPANLASLAKELQGLQEEDLDWDPEYIRLVSAILSAVEQCLIRQCSRAMRVTAWQRMDLDLRKKIQTLARLEPIDIKRSKPVSKAFSFGGNTRNQDLYQVKLAIQAHTKRALAQDTQLYKATQTQDAANVQTAERGVQANHDLREGRILKSNSRAHVPQALRASSQSANVSERNSINTAHRRTQSEAPIPTTKKVAKEAIIETKSNESTKQKVPRLADIRPRYLEPRKARTVIVNGSTGPIRSATSSSIPATKGKGHHLSSSDSSRHSSPAARKNALNANKIGTKSANMSLDNLSSSTRRSKNSLGKSSDNDPCNDSLNESMKSSVITNKTISHESLSGVNKLSRSNPVIHNNKIIVNRQTQSTKMNNTNKSHNRPTSINNKTSRHLQQQNITSNGSSPSSINTNKSAASRLSSVSSTQSARDIYKQRSISVPAQDVTTTTAGQRRSFLSAKSREILAKRAEKNKQQQQQQLQQQTNSSGDEKVTHHVTGPMRSASHTAVTTLNNNTQNRNSLPSNIPTRRPNTLHLKKTIGINNKVNNSNAITTANNKNKITSIAANGVFKAAQAVKQKIDLLIDTKATVPDIAPICTESKLERSSTFCKESSDLELNELQIIE